MDTLRLATWNIGSLHVNYQANVQALKRIVEGYPQDILCMQEFPNDVDLTRNIMEWGGFSGFLFLETSESHVFKEANMGNAIFSKWGLERVDTIQLPTPAVQVAYNGRPETWHPKFFTANLCDVGNDVKILLITGHGFPFHRYQLENPRQKHIIRPPFMCLDEWASQLREKYIFEKVYMAADFNIANPLEYMPLCQSYGVDVFAGEATRPSGRKTDAIILPKGCKLLKKDNITMVNDSEGIRFDHNFIAAEFAIMSNLSET